MGSKNAIAQWVVSHLPSASTLYDMFAGGCAVTHAAMLSDRFGRIVANDIQGDVPQMFLDAIAGRYRNERRWISRDDFILLKDSDAYVRTCWSFGGNGREYLYNAEREPFARLGWQLLTADTFDDRFDAYKRLCDDIYTYASKAIERVREAEKQKSRGVIETFAPEHVKDVDRFVAGQTFANIMRPIIDYFVDAKKACKMTLTKIDEHLISRMSSHYFTRRSQWLLPNRRAYHRMQQIMPQLNRNYDDVRAEYERLKDIYAQLTNPRPLDGIAGLSLPENINRLTRVNALTRLAHLPQPIVSAHDYREVEIAPNSIIYCDPPYRDSAEYTTEAFDHDAFYDWCLRQTSLVIISEYDMPGDFVEIDSISKISKYSSKNKLTTERLFVPRQFAGYVKPGQLF